MDERVEVRRRAQGHFKRKHGFSRSLWVSRRSNRRLLSFKKGAVSLSPIDRAEEVKWLIIMQERGNPGSHSNDRTREALIEREVSACIAREIT